MWISFWSSSTALASRDLDRQSDFFEEACPPDCFDSLDAAAPLDLSSWYCMCELDLVILPPKEFSWAETKFWGYFFSFGLSS